ncbi:uncharacterized NAD(FAD)-dependent dehydrogenase [Microbacterium testaceum StLB037]|uniref:Uncharacterized NAD(FAD)-dependent dehydrogenase n=1 Tax=Microbacterium testaceum (strain StLB037) TaxID=979556 RepID=E8NDU2_MICTS|nr:uncharacterized NAD(FAD)-dependent dehydrogenase [Microbacterium testaceum StLB037]
MSATIASSTPSGASSANAGVIPPATHTPTSTIAVAILLIAKPFSRKAHVCMPQEEAREQTPEAREPSRIPTRRFTRTRRGAGQSPARPLVENVYFL